MLNDLKNKKVLILGLGKEGKSSFNFLRKLFPKKVIGIADQNPKVLSHYFCSGINLKKDKKVKLHLGKNYLKALKNYDLIIKSAGIPIHLPEIEKAFRDNKITSQTKIFFEHCPGMIIGVTGTKGKSTTASLIYHILKACPERSRRAHLVGNIGKPVLNLLFSATPKDIYVYELSSHQLYNLKRSPQIAVLLNVYPEHLDYYRSFKEYISAKANITRYQTKKDYLIFNSGDKIVREIAKKSKARKISFQGKNYTQDLEAAKKVAKIFKILEKTIRKAMKEFKPLPHRLELVGTFKGITFYNDALSTIPETTIAAMEKLGNRVETIMLGGFERNLNFKNLAKEILKSKIKNIILFPTTGKRIWGSIQRALRQKHMASHIEPFFVDNMKQAVKTAYENTGREKICLLSTASPSFSIFRDYKEKGGLFKKYVKQYGRKSQ